MRYVVSGGIAAAGAYVSAFLLYRWFGADYLLSQSVGFLVGTCINYPISRGWVFRNRYQGVPVQFGVFIVVAGVGLGINELALAIAVRMVHFPVALAMACGLGAAFVWNFMANYAVTFGRLR